MNKNILAFESSCDDTSVAIIKNDGTMYNVTKSSTSIQALHGGIVPELASRKHEAWVLEITEEVLKQANLKIENIDVIGYTAFPGLVGSIHVTKVFANILSKALNKEVYQLNHMLGHVYSYYIDHDEPLVFPLYSLVVSGGHTTLYEFNSLLDSKVLCETNDDAIGEALDKVGRYLNLEYPGGISIDKIYDESKANIKFLAHTSASSDFTFSGFKTSVLNYIHKHKQKKEEIDTIQVASSALKYAIDDVMNKVKYHLTKSANKKTLVLGGGVSANSLLRKEVLKLNNIDVKLPTLKYTNDNALMMANLLKLMMSIKN